MRPRRARDALREGRARRGRRLARASPALAERLHTRESANALIPELGELLVDLRSQRAVLVDRELTASLAAHAPGNGGGDGAREFTEAALRFSSGLGQIDEWNVILRDLDKGLCDFPSVRRGVAIYLCWELGEPEVAFWHGVDEGARGRKPLGPDD